MVLDHFVIQKLNAQGRLEKKEAKQGTGFDKNELLAILRIGAEELFKDDKNEEDQKSKLENMDIDEILSRAEKVETKTAEVDADGNELLRALKVANSSNTEDDATFWSRLIPPEAAMQAEVKKFGDSSRVKLIAKEARSAVAETSVSSWPELWDALGNGCKDVARRAGAHSKFCKLTYPSVNFRIVFAFFGHEFRV